MSPEAWTALTDLEFSEKVVGGQRGGGVYLCLRLSVGQNLLLCPCDQYICGVCAVLYNINHNVKSINVCMNCMYKTWQKCSLHQGGELHVSVMPQPQNGVP